MANPNDTNPFLLRQQIAILVQGWHTDEPSLNDIRRVRRLMAALDDAISQRNPLEVEWESRKQIIDVDVPQVERRIVHIFGDWNDGTGWVTCYDADTGEVLDPYTHEPI